MKYGCASSHNAHLLVPRSSVASTVVDVGLPIGQEAAERSDEVGTAAGEVGALAWVNAEIEQQQLARVDQQLPLSEPNGALLTIGAIPAPEQAAFEERRFPAKDRKDVDPIRTIARGSVRAGGGQDRRRDVCRVELHAGERTPRSREADRVGVPQDRPPVRRG